MAVNKIDPKVIFASEAPAQDTPAVFTNRTVGWGETRKNGGRPTIKQMNAEQQSTDLKILWLNENAVTPYDSTIDYPVDAVTIKDGVFKIFNGSVWNLFLDKTVIGLGNVDNTSDLNKPVSTATQTALDLKADKSYVDNSLPHNNLIDRNSVGAHEAVAILTANGETQQQINDHGGVIWYAKSGGYGLNDRVILSNGDIVRSTVANNTNNPNVDMTGWVETNNATQLKYKLKPNLTSLAVSEKLAERVSTKDFGSIGDGTAHTLQEWVDVGKFSNLTAIQVVYPHAIALTDSVDWLTCQAAIDYVGAGGSILFNQTEVNCYVIDRPLKFYSGQKWNGCGGVDVLGLGTELRLVASASSVAEPKNPSTTTYGFNPVGIYFNAQNFGESGLSLYNTSYANVDQCAANSSKVNGCGFLFDSDTSKQCYFNKLNLPRAFASGVGGSAFRFIRGANANQIFGGKAGGSYRGAEFTSLSSGNLIVGTDFEENTDCHVYVDVSNNCFIGLHMEVSPIGFNITENGWGTRRIGTTFASTVVIQVQDLSKAAANLDYRQDGTGELQYSIFKSTVTSLSTSAAQNNDLNLTSGTENILFNWFRNTNSSSLTKRITFYKADGTATESFRFDLATAEFQCGDITQKSFTGVQRKIIRAAAIPVSGTYSNGDVVKRTNNSTTAVVTEWTCVTSGSQGTWQATAWTVMKGVTASRPALTANDAGVQYFDTTLAAAGKPIWWTGVTWVDALGASV